MPTPTAPRGVDQRLTGEPTTTTGVGRLLDVVLAGYSVVVFATLPGIVGAFLIERRAAESDASSQASPL